MEATAALILLGFAQPCHKRTGRAKRLQSLRHHSKVGLVAVAVDRAAVAVAAAVVVAEEASMIHGQRQPSLCNKRGKQMPYRK
jgi:hypothetical protein